MWGARFSSRLLLAEAEWDWKEYLCASFSEDSLNIILIKNIAKSGPVCEVSPVEASTLLSKQGNNWISVEKSDAVLLHPRSSAPAVNPRLTIFHFI